MEVKVFKPAEKMTFSTVVADSKRFIKYCQGIGDEFINLDLSEVTHCDSAGLALLIEVKRLSLALRKICKIQGVPNVVRTLAEFYSLDSLLNLANLEE